MDVQQSARVVVRSSAEAPATWAMASLFERLASSRETEGAFDLTLVTQPPGVATPLHVHTREAEAFFLLEGALRYKAGEEVHELVAGSFIYLPRGVPHAFRVTGDRPVRFVGIVAPGGLMDLYDEVGLPASEHRIPGPDGRQVAEEIPRWNEFSPRYGLQVVGPPLPAERRTAPDRLGLAPS